MDKEDKKVEVELKIIKNRVPENFDIKWKCWENFPGSEEEKELDKKLDIKKQKATDIADKYICYHEEKYCRPNGIGYCALPVLQFLWGKPWDNMAENFLASLRPSAVRVSYGSLTSDAHTWRITVILENDKRTIKKIEQEVEVGLTGCRYGTDVIDYINGRESKKDTGTFIINTNAIKKLNIYK